MNDTYFSLRNIAAQDTESLILPAYMAPLLPPPSSKILDFGCGFGQVLKSLHAKGYSNSSGADINSEAIEHLRLKGIAVHDMAEEFDFFERNEKQFDFIIMSHVLEHIKKTEIVSMLKNIRSLLSKNGQLLIMVPNAQSNTGAYWAYEDFTHETIFTSGSLIYVLRAAGFKHVNFIDEDCTAGLSAYRAFLKKILLQLYKANKFFWNKVTSSSFHAPSPQIYTYEIKALARG